MKQTHLTNNSAETGVAVSSEAHERRPAISRRAAMLGVAVGSGATLIGSAGSALAVPTATDKAGDTDEIGSVWWVELVAVNDTKSAAHYSAVVGWNTKKVALSDGARPAKPEEPAYTLFMTNGNEVAGGYQVDPRDPVKNKPMWIVYFRVDNVDKAIIRAVNGGGRVLTPPYDVPGIARMALLADIDGVSFGVAAPL